MESKFITQIKIKKKGNIGNEKFNKTNKRCRGNRLNKQKKEYKRFLYLDINKENMYDHIFQELWDIISSVAG
jgi:hypothetical protein